MKFLFLGLLLGLSSISNAEFIKIADKMYDKVTTISADGATSKTAFIPVAQVQTTSQAKTPESLIAKVAPIVSTFVQNIQESKSNQDKDNGKEN